jgi:hypothetical protein
MEPLQTQVGVSFNSVALLPTPNVEKSEQGLVRAFPVGDVLHWRPSVVRNR